MLNHDLLSSVPCCFLLNRLIKEATCNVMVDHLQSRVTPWRQYASHVKVRGTLSKMDVHVEEQSHFTCILNVYSLCKTRTGCIQTLSLIILHVHKLRRLVQYFDGLWFSFFNFRLFVWCFLLANLPRYRNLNFATDLFLLTHLASLSISKFLYARMFTLI